jgi:hypothetical protein
MNNVVKNAVETMTILKFTYDGHHRVVEPHAHGISTAGNEVLRCYQTAGGSVSGTVPGWHLMKVSKMVNISATDSHFDSPRPGYKRGDKGMTTIYAQI